MGPPACRNILPKRQDVGKCRDSERWALGNALRPGPQAGVARLALGLTEILGTPGVKQMKTKFHERTGRNISIHIYDYYNPSDDCSRSNSSQWEQVYIPYARQCVGCFAHVILI